MKRALAALAALLLLLPPASALAAPQQGSMEDYAAALLQEENIARRAEKLEPLTLSAELCAIAEQLALEQKGILSAQRPGGRGWETALDDAGYAYVRGLTGRNVLQSATNHTSIELARAWLKDSAARENVLRERVTHTGIYVHYFLDEKTYYFVQIFARPAAKPIGNAAGVLHQALVKTDGAAVYAGKGTKKLMSLGRGAEVSVSRIEGKWARLFWFDGRFAYIRLADIEKKSAATVKAGPSNATVRLPAYGYAGPATLYPEVVALAKGSRVHVRALVQGKAGGGWEWAELACEGGVVLTQVSRLKLDDPPGSYPVSVPKSDYGPYGGATLREAAPLRIGPGEEYPARLRLNAGDEVSVHALNGAWAMVRAFDESYFVFVPAKLLTRTS